MKKSKFSIIVFLVAISFSVIIPIRYYYREVKPHESPFIDIGGSIRFEYAEDKDIYKYADYHDDLMKLFWELEDNYKRTNKTFEEDWKYRIILGYNQNDSDNKNNKVTEVLFKSESLTVNGVEYVTRSREMYEEKLHLIKLYYESDDFKIIKKRH